MNDRLSLHGLRAFGRHGVLAAELSDGQEFVVDVALTLDTRPAAHSDDLAATVDYGQLAERIVAVVAGEPVALIETLAARIAQECLAPSGVEEAEVTVHKPQAPLSVPFTDVTLTIRRRREGA